MRQVIRKKEHNKGHTSNNMKCNTKIDSLSSETQMGSLEELFHKMVWDCVILTALKRGVRIYIVWLKLSILYWNVQCLLCHVFCINFPSSSYQTVEITSQNCIFLTVPLFSRIPKILTSHETSYRCGANSAFSF